jgi:hypothetical protein
VKIEAAFTDGPGTPPTQLRLDESRLYRVQWIRGIRPAADVDRAPAGWFVATLEATSDLLDETLTASFIVGPCADDPSQPDWGTMQATLVPSEVDAAFIQQNESSPANATTSQASNPQSPSRRAPAVDSIAEPSWRRTSCLVCSARIVRARDAFVMIGGTLDGSWLTFWPSGPDHMAMSGPVPDGAAIHLFGACHRDCLEMAPQRIRDHEAHLDPNLPELSFDEVGDIAYALHRPADASTCPFCGGAGPMTDEHVWPKWLSKELRRLGATFARPPGLKRAPIDLDFTVGLCRECNNNWLSTLENDVASIAMPMLRGHLVRLNEVKQRRLATWATKMAYLIDRMSEPVVPRGFPMDLAIRREPPESTYVFLAAYDGSRAAYASCKRLRVAGPDGIRPAEPNVFVATFTAHKLAFQVLGHFTTGGWQLNDDRSGLRDGLLQIWPNAQPTVTWPPRLILPNAGIDALATSVSE